MFVEFDSDHILHWGRLHEAQDVQIEWHGEASSSIHGGSQILTSPVPNAEEIDFVLEILGRVANPILDKLDTLLQSASRWNDVDRNDFCR